MKLRLFFGLLFGVIIAYLGNAHYANPETSWLLWVESLSVDTAVYIQEFFADALIARVIVVSLVSLLVGLVLGLIWQIVLASALCVAGFFFLQDAVGMSRIGAVAISGICFILIWAVALGRTFAVQNPQRYTKGTRKLFLNLKSVFLTILGATVVYGISWYYGAPNWITIPVLAVICWLILRKSWIKAG